MDFGKAPFHFWAIRFDALSNTDYYEKNRAGYCLTEAFPDARRSRGAAPRPPGRPRIASCRIRGDVTAGASRPWTSSGRKVRALQVYAEGAIAAAGYGAA